VFVNKVYLTPLALIDLQGQKRHYVNLLDKEMDKLDFHAVLARTPYT
jgi:hypothetical protein